MWELREVGVAARKEIPLPVVYKDVYLDAGYFMDIVIESQLVLELKTVEKLLPIHEAQLLTYLKLSGIHTGLLINFNTPVLRDGIKRIVCGAATYSAPRTQ